MTPRAPLALTAGDPAGVGPEICVRAAVSFEDEPVAIYGDAEQLRRLAIQHSVSPSRLAYVAGLGGVALPAGTIALVDVGRVSPSAADALAPTKEGGLAQIAALERALDDLEHRVVRALVTAPTSKAAVNMAGIPFSGQTEFLAQRVGMPQDAVSMMFLGPRLCVALVTTHLALRDVSREVTAARVRRTIVHLAEALCKKKPGEAIRIAVAGLNPHAGEGGLFGDEEIRTVAPVVASIESSLPKTVRLVGLLPSETAFRKAASGDIDGVVAMAHDHATIASKLLDWESAVNVTWGLPFVRTSVDHGVAYDVVGTDRVGIRGMQSAIALALRLSSDCTRSEGARG